VVSLSFAWKRSGTAPLAGTLGGVDVAVVLSAHELLWERRAAVLRDWECVVRCRDELTVKLERQRVAREAALVRAGRGLTARQRAWAQRHATFETRPRDRAGRQVLVTWLYHRERVEATEARWAELLETRTTALEQAELDLGEATRALLEIWGRDAPEASGRTRRALRAMARRGREAAGTNAGPTNTHPR
jgi:hypothetical protein